MMGENGHGSFGDIATLNVGTVERLNEWGGSIKSWGISIQSIRWLAKRGAVTPQQLTFI